MAEAHAQRVTPFLLPYKKWFIGRPPTSVLRRSSCSPSCGTESQFDPNARSHVGASGLMQLLPVTAERIGSGQSPAFGSLHPAFVGPMREHPSGGAWYIRSLLDRYDGQVPLAIAAYNAGPVAVDGWLEDLAGLDLRWVLMEADPHIRNTRLRSARVLGTILPTVCSTSTSIYPCSRPNSPCPLPADAVGFSGAFDEPWRRPTKKRDAEAPARVRGAQGAARRVGQIDRDQTPKAETFRRHLDVAPAF